MSLLPYTRVQYVRLLESFFFLLFFYFYYTSTNFVHCVFVFKPNWITPAIKSKPKPTKNQNKNSTEKLLNIQRYNCIDENTLLITALHAIRFSFFVEYLTENLKFRKNSVQYNCFGVFVDDFSSTESNVCVFIRYFHSLSEISWIRVQHKISTSAGMVFVCYFLFRRCSQLHAHAQDFLIQSNHLHGLHLWQTGQHMRFFMYFYMARRDAI